MQEQVKNFNNYDSENKVQSTKKFVFQIYSDNIEFIETLSYQEKNDLINYLVSEYQVSSNSNKKFNSGFNLAGKITLIILAFAVGIPLLFYILGVSFDLTKASYYSMQQNFEKLF